LGVDRAGHVEEFELLPGGQVDRVVDRLAGWSMEPVTTSPSCSGPLGFVGSTGCPVEPDDPVDPDTPGTMCCASAAATPSDGWPVNATSSTQSFNRIGSTESIATAVPSGPTTV